MSIQIAKDELASLTEFQQELHMTDDAGAKIISNFYAKFIKCTWYSSVPLRLKSTSDGDDVIYTVNNSFHYLQYSYMRFVLPQISVRPEYKDRFKIAWCHNVGTNIVISASFREDDITYQNWDNVWADIYFQFYQNKGAGMRENHKFGIGNIPRLETLSEFLPRHAINVDQPWFYSMDTAMAFPIFYKGSLTRAEHRYTFRTKITDLLRIKALDRNGHWVDYTGKTFRFLDTGRNNSLSTPELWGRYAYLDEPELHWYEHCNNKERIYYIRDIESYDTPNPNKYGSTASIPLPSKRPALAMFWVSENKISSRNKNFSNYTTDTENLYLGCDPVRTTSLTYTNGPRLSNMPSDHFSIAEPRKHFPSSPNETGYHAYSFACKSSNKNADIGMVLGAMNATISCEISNNDIINSREDEHGGHDSEGEGEDEVIADISNAKNDVEFTTRVRLLVIRKFSVIYEKDSYKFVVN